MSMDVEKTTSIHQELGYRMHNRANMKRIISAVLTLALVLCIIPAGTWTTTAKALTSGDYEYYVNDDGKTVTITKYANTQATSVVIPKQIGGKAVTSIGESAFKSFKRLISITIPNSVTRIGDSAFAYCTNLTNITIPNSVTSIENYAFWYCTGLKSITIPNSVTSIGEGAFAGCTSLKSITIPNSVTSIGYGAFAGCTNLRSITIPNSVTNIGTRAFDNCTSLTSIIIPNSVTSIGVGAFAYCTNLTSMTIPNSVTNFGEWAFKGCTSLTSITIPNSVTSIEMSSFGYCTSLKSITIPNSVTSIGWWAFEYCTNLTSVTIPNSVTSIGNHAFENCKSLTSVTIPSSVTSIGYDAFKSCDKLTTIYGTAGSYAESYAKRHGIIFSKIDTTKPEKGDTSTPDKGDSSTPDKNDTPTPNKGEDEPKLDWVIKDEEVTIEYGKTVSVKSLKLIGKSKLHISGVLKVRDNADVQGGELSVSGRLNVSQNLLVGKSSTFNMSGSSVVVVGGDFEVSNSNTNKLTGGTLCIGGGFTQINNGFIITFNKNFSPEGSHSIVFFGNEKVHSIKFADTKQSYFNNIYLQDGNALSSKEYTVKGKSGIVRIANGVWGPLPLEYTVISSNINPDSGTDAFIKAYNKMVSDVLSDKNAAFLKAKDIPDFTAQENKEIELSLRLIAAHLQFYRVSSNSALNAYSKTYNQVTLKVGSKKKSVTFLFEGIGVSGQKFVTISYAMKGGTISSKEAKPYATYMEANFNNLKDSINGYCKSEFVDGIKACFNIAYKFDSKNFIEARVTNQILAKYLTRKVNEKHSKLVSESIKSIYDVIFHEEK